VRIAVRDIGSGIDPDLEPRIFEMFTQGSTELEHGRSGLGVGLTLARSLVEMHGGRIEVHSAGVGLGSEFVVYLPVASAVPGKKEEEKEPEVAAPNGVPRRRILVVDDNADQAESLRMLLELHGHEVELAFDGPSALAAAIKMEPDFALIDIGLPGMSGYEVARRIRENKELDRATLVAQTGWSQDHDRLRSEQAGFDHHLIKPVDLELLNKILASPRTNGD
jgi:CheY-like chemotaxis protein